MLSRVKRALVLEPHPDDLVIGCGGLTQKLVAQGTYVHCLLMSQVPPSYLRSTTIRAPTRPTTVPRAYAKRTRRPAFWAWADVRSRLITNGITSSMPCRSATW